MSNRDELDEILNTVKKNSEAPGNDSPPPEYRKPAPSGGKPVKSGGHPGGSKKKKKKKKASPARTAARIVTTLATVLGSLAVAAGLAYFIVVSAYDLLGLSQSDEQIEIEVTAKDTISSVAERLKEEKMIAFTLPFKLYAKLKGGDERLEPGKHLITDNMSYDYMLRSLGSTEDEGISEVQITFPEGLTLNQIADMLDKNNVCSGDELIKLLESDTFGFSFETMIPEDDLRFYKFEGYLFPDTYNFYVGEIPKSVIKRFFTRFNEQVSGAPVTRMKEIGLTLDETITLASIIQAEANNPDDMAMVSSVFHNRLENPSDFNGMLQSDPTILYVNKNIKPKLDIANQEMYDAYNTYVCEGLPVGPICNPGMDAINAALNPADTEYYYFVTDNAGQFYYATTLDEHNANVAEVNRVNKQLAEEAKAAKQAESNSSAASE